MLLPYSEICYLVTTVIFNAKSWYMFLACLPPKNSLELSGMITTSIPNFDQVVIKIPSVLQRTFLLLVDGV